MDRPHPEYQPGEDEPPDEWGRPHCRLRSSSCRLQRRARPERGRAVLVTRRKDGGLQSSSPMAVVADDDGNVLTATRASNAKTYNLARDPRAMLCLFTERWPGPWLHVEGEAAIERLPGAMPLLADDYRRRGQDTTTQAFRERMLDESRVLIRVTPQRVVRRPTS